MYVYVRNYVRIVSRWASRDHSKTVISLAVTVFLAVLVHWCSVQNSVTRKCSFQTSFGNSQLQCKYSVTNSAYPPESIQVAVSISELL